MLLLFALVLGLTMALALPQVRGWLGEKATTVGIGLRLDAETYRSIDTVIVPSRNGTTQIDHIVVSAYGIFVIETKNLKGWIFGSAQDDTWTQVLFGKNYRFQNPLKQNYRHTRALAEYLHLDHRVFHSVVGFIGDCMFKTVMPANVLASGLTRYIESFRARCLSEAQVAETNRERPPGAERTPRRHAERALAVASGASRINDRVPALWRTLDAADRETGSRVGSISRLFALSHIQVSPKPRVSRVMVAGGTDSGDGSVTRFRREQYSRARGGADAANG